MKSIFHLAINDFKHVFRDKMLYVFLFAPVALICFVRFFVPFIAAIYPVVNEYTSYIMMFGGIQTAIMFGFITAFIILEEKDENVLQAIRVLPVSPVYFISYRLLFATCFSAIAAFFMLLFSNLAWPGYINSVLLAVHYGLAAPFITLLIATYAKNKIEGLGFFKGIDLLILIPIVGFFLPDGWKYMMSFVPVFWTYELYHASLSGTSVVFPFLTGLILYLLVFVLLAKQFQKRVFGGL